MVQLREEFFNIDSELYTIYLSNHRTAELPPLPSFYDIPQQSRGANPAADEFQELIPPQTIAYERLKGMTIASQAICLYVACDEIDFPLRLELWDSPPEDLDEQNLSNWFYIAEVSFDLSNGELYLHGLMDHDVAKPIYIAPDMYRLRFYLGSLNALDESYTLEHWPMIEDEDELEDEDDLEELGPRIYDPERNVWCRLVLWPNPYLPPQDILSSLALD
ncbi:hypothetical protein [Acaryochloris marina]|uniref:hypothetical protein n=1 Tax=Acaryochloris marina TaxID=155978 RepID=UPI001EE68C7B|nr:hypothetical protein [Acaryochloris marina]